MATAAAGARVAPAATLLKINLISYFLLMYEEIRNQVYFKRVRAQWEFESNTRVGFRNSI